MCGIVGYYGHRNPVEVIISGLKKLEYRGYDSAGLAIHNGTSINRVRASGKLIQLEKKLLEITNLHGSLGIGHTRWATHGVPSEANAHPHCSGGLVVVHNGIIENYQEIKHELLKQHVVLESETDTELVAHLLSQEVEKTGSLYKAVKNVLPKLRGAFSFLVIWDKEPNTMVAFKEGPPLIFGIGQNEFVVASDVQAILAITDQIIYLEDQEIAVISNENVNFYSINGMAIEKQKTKITWNQDVAEKQGFDHFMLKEIFEQPRSLAAAMSQHIDLTRKEIKLNKVGFNAKSFEILPSLDPDEDWETTSKCLSKVERVFLIACGTSYYAAMVGKYLIEKFAQLPVEVDIASEFRYRSPIIPSDSLFVVISQSGETADTLAALRLAKTKNVLTLSICNNPGSSIDRESQGHLYMNAGPEIGVASTKAFTSTLVLLNLLSLTLSKVKSKLSKNIEEEVVQALSWLPSQLESVLVHDKFFAKAGESLLNFRGFLYMGRGVTYPVALEGALKMKELAYKHAEGYAAGEMKHGPLALIDESMAVIMIAPNDDVYEKTVSNLEEARARGGQIISIGSAENEKIKNISKYYLSIPNAHWSINPILAVVPLQLMAYHLANSLGLDVDQPRNLAKSVTVE